MRIVITGAHVVGKTTLAEKLQEVCPGYELYAEPYYELAERGHVFSAIPTADEYIVQLDYAIKQITKSGGNAIFDRCPVDLLAYVLATDHLINTELLFAKVATAMRTIDLLVFVPIEDPDIIAGSGADLPELRTQVNDILVTMISDFDIPVMEVKGSLTERLSQISNKMQEYR